MNQPPKPADRCPGVFQTHAAADGRLARIRLTGGRIDAGALEALALAAEEFGDGGIEITVRGNLQVRGIAEGEAERFGARMLDVALSLGEEHDRIRNIVVSPLSGRIGGRADMWPAADALAAALLDHAWTHELSGRFWFGFDDGRGDVLRRNVDVTALASGPDDAELIVAGEPTGRVVALDRLPAAMLDVAAEFVRRRTDEWRITELASDHRDAVRDAVAAHGRGGSAAEPPVGELRPLVGWMDQPDGRVTLGAVVPFGRLTTEQARYAAAIGGPVIMTPEREILLLDLSESVAETVVRVLAPLGFVFDGNSPWTRLSACTGSPGCAKSVADVRGDLLAAVGREVAASDGHEHWVGCDRACGSPAHPHTLRIATGDGYRTIAR